MCSGRVALLGDGIRTRHPFLWNFIVERTMSDLITAAHSMTSFLGQGACQAIEDATELANLLSLYFTPESSSPGRRGTDSERPLSIPDLLQRYSDARSSRAQKIASFSTKYAMFHTAQLPYGLGPIVRQLVYTWVPLWCFIWCFAWLYGYQPVVNGVSQVMVWVYYLIRFLCCVMREVCRSMEPRLMILSVTAPEPSKWAEERRREHMEVDLEGVGIMEGKRPGERGVKYN